MKIFEVQVSKGALHVWSTNIVVKARNEKVARAKAVKMAEQNIEGTKDIVWNDDGLTDYNVQSEECTEIKA